MKWFLANWDQVLVALYQHLLIVGITLAIPR